MGSRSRDERVDVDGGRERLPGDLLRCGVIERERAAGVAGELRFVGGALLHQLRDAEIEELHLPALRYEDVGGLQVAVQDKVGVRVRDRIDHLIDEIQPLLHIEPLCVGELPSTYSSARNDCPSTATPAS